MVTKKREGKKVSDVLAYQSIFNSLEGKKVLYDLMKVCHLVDSTFVKDPQEMALREGMRNVGLYILNKLNTDVIGLKQMIDDRSKAEREYDFE